MMKQKIISIIIPVYNVEEYLPRCMESIISNSYSCLEIICINDGSTDNSLKILEDYKKRDKRIYIINQKNSGVASARNAGLRVAKGEFIAFIDPDDWVHKEYFMYLYKAIIEANADIAICDYIQTSDIKALYGDRKYSMRKMTVEEMSSNHHTKTYVWKRLYKKKIIKNILFDEKVTVEDSVFNLEVIVKNDNLKIVYVDAKLYAYYIRAGSLVSQFNNRDFLQLAEIFLKYCSKEKRKSIVSIIAEDAIKKALVARYISKIQQDETNVKKSNYVIDDGLKYIRQGKFKYVLFRYIPELYRVFRIIDDKSMLDYERQLKQYNRREDIDY